MLIRSGTLALRHAVRMGGLIGISGLIGVWIVIFWCHKMSFLLQKSAVSHAVCQKSYSKDFYHVRLTKTRPIDKVIEWLFRQGSRFLCGKNREGTACFGRDNRRNLPMDMNQVLAAELNVKPWQVEAAVKLIDEGNTIPFISRYRKEATGSLNDEILRNLYDRLMYLRSLNDRKAVVLASIEEQGKLTAELKKSIEEAATLVVVEDLYRPYRPKRRTRATIAKEKRTGAAGEYHSSADDKRAARKSGRGFCFRRKGSQNGKRRHCWCLRHHRREHFR